MQATNNIDKIKLEMRIRYQSVKILLANLFFGGNFLFLKQATQLSKQSRAKASN